MTEVGRFWETWAPYLSYIEDNHLDLANIEKLGGVISDPVLIVGAGQGLLVEQLQKSGHKVDGVDLSPQMVKYAEMRRGLKLIEADARNLPFASEMYNTTIISTGVVDFLHDEPPDRIDRHRGKTRDTRGRKGPRRIRWGAPRGREIRQTYRSDHGQRDVSSKENVRAD